MTMDAKVIWKDKLNFVGLGSKQFSIPLNSEAFVDGEPDSLAPMELVAIGLAGCTAMDVIAILEKKRQVVTAFEVQVHAERASEFPKVFTNIVIEYIVEGHHVEPAAVERSIELSATKYCPVQAMLKSACKIEHKYTIKDAG